MSKKNEYKDKRFRFVSDKEVTYVAFGYHSFHIDPDTGEIIGLSDKPKLVDKWLNRGKIEEIKETVARKKEKPTISDLKKDAETEKAKGESGEANTDK